jgi:Cu+-exporting ATPase
MDVLLDKQSSWSKRFLASDTSVGTVVAIGFLLTAGVLITTILTGGLALPVLSFTAGAITALSSSCFILAGLLSALFLTLSITYAFEAKKINKQQVMGEIQSPAVENKKPELAFKERSGSGYPRGC